MRTFREIEAAISDGIVPIDHCEQEWTGGLRDTDRHSRGDLLVGRTRPDDSREKLRNA